MHDEDEDVEKDLDLDLDPIEDIGESFESEDDDDPENKFR